MCDRRALNQILTTKTSPLLERKLKAVNDAAAAIKAIEAKVNSQMRNMEKAGDAAGLDREAVKKLNMEALSRNSVFEDIRNEVTRTTNEILIEEDVFCHWLGDRQLHVADLQSGWSMFQEYFFSYENGDYDVILDDESCKGLFDCAKKIVNELTDLEAILRHAALASKVLHAEIPEAVMKVLESDTEMFGDLKDHLFSDLYAEAVLSLSGHPDEEIIPELFKMLYPAKDWKDLVIQTDPASMEKSREKAEDRKWKDELKRRHPAAYLTMKDISMLREFSDGMIEKAERFVELVEKGLLPSDAMFLLFHDASERQIEFHLSIDMCLGVEGLRHAEIFQATKHFSQENCERFAKKLNAYAKWMRAMPNEMPDAERQVISAILAISSDAPARRGKVFGLLMQNAIEVVGELQSSSPAYLGDFFAYLVSSWAEAKKHGDSPLDCAPPHGSLEFSKEMNYYIGQDQISAEDARLAIAYALKASEGNANRGGRYISATAFRSMLKKVLPCNDVKDVLPWEKRDPTIRASEVEVHLAKHGVIVYKRNDQLIGLNMDESGKRRSEQEPTERGKEILRVTRDWMLARDKKTSDSFGMLAQAGPAQLLGDAAQESAQAPGPEISVFEKARSAIDEYSKGIVERFLSQGDMGQIIQVLRKRFAEEGQDEQGAAIAKKEMLETIRESVKDYESGIIATKKEFDARGIPGEKSEAG